MLPAFSAICSLLATAAAVSVLSGFPTENYEIQILTKLEGDQFLAGINSGVEVYPMTHQNGKNYNCYIPELTENTHATIDERQVWKQDAAGLVNKLVGAPLFASEQGATFLLTVGTTFERTQRGKAMAHSAFPAATAPYMSDQDDLPTLADGRLAYIQHYEADDGSLRATIQYECDPSADPSALELISVRETNLGNFSARVRSGNPKLCAKLVSPQAIVASMNGTCARSAQGWWTFEVCLGQQIRQYHDDRGTVTQESILGVYDWRAGEQIDKSRVGEAPSIVQKYGDGTPCELLMNAPRRASVHFECSPHPNADTSAITLTAIQEPSTCVYRIVVSSSAACNHLDLRPLASRAVQPPASVIACIGP